MLLPGTHDTVMVRGVTWTFRVQWLTTALETPVDLTNWTGALKIKSRKQSTDSLTQLTTANGRLTLDDEGNIVGTLTATQVDALPLGTLWYELELSSSEESVQLLAGRVRVDP